MVEIPQRVLDRVHLHFNEAGPGECWPWKLSVGSHGYGQIGWWDNVARRSRMTTAQRAVWIARNGPIPDGMVVDHICHNRLCCNRWHMRLLPMPINSAITSTAIDAAWERAVA